MIYTGVGGWNFAPWRGEFYPRGLPQTQELAYMSEQLDSIEINSTFYGLQKPATFQRWHDATPARFMFSVKGPMFVSNRRDLAQSDAGLKRFFESGVLQLGRKLGPINWQLSPGKPFVATEIEAFLSLLPGKLDGGSIRHAIEVRHPSFATPEFVELARRFRTAIVLAGDAEYPQIANLTSTFAYLRIMGTADSRKMGYTAAALDRWASALQEIAAGAVPAHLHAVPGQRIAKSRVRDVFCYVISGAKRRNPAAARALSERLHAG